MNCLYFAEEASAMECDYEVLILSNGYDDRSLAMSKILNNKSARITEILILQYENGSLDKIHALFPSAHISSINISINQADFLMKLISIQAILETSKILIDVSCIHTPEMFTLLKYFELSNPKPSIDIAYSIPFDYEFQNEPFTSYHSYYGDLRTNDLLGYGGNLDGSAYSKMIIFLGFEGALSSKVAEDIQYDDLLLVNNLPSFFPKYRDISIINNYDLLTGQHGKYLYVPASNPFETYNFLCRTLQESEHVCIAPLSTKPVALGICMYALAHKNLRVVYPMSDQYNYHRTNRVLRTFIYRVPLDKIRVI